MINGIVRVHSKRYIIQAIVNPRKVSYRRFVYREMVASFAYRRLIWVRRIGRDRRDGEREQAREANRKLSLVTTGGHLSSLASRSFSSSPTSLHSRVSVTCSFRDKTLATRQRRVSVFRRYENGNLPVRHRGIAPGPGEGRRETRKSFPRRLTRSCPRIARPDLVPVACTVTDYELPPRRGAEKIGQNPQLSPTAKEFAICGRNTLISETCLKSLTSSKDKFIKCVYRLSKLSHLSISRKVESNCKKNLEDSRNCKRWEKNRTLREKYS